MTMQGTLRESAAVIRQIKRARSEGRVIDPWLELLRRALGSHAQVVRAMREIEIEEAQAADVAAIREGLEQIAQQRPHQLGSDSP